MSLRCLSFHFCIVRCICITTSLWIIKPQWGTYENASESFSFDIFTFWGSWPIPCMNLILWRYSVRTSSCRFCFGGVRSFNFCCSAWEAFILHLKYCNYAKQKLPAPLALTTSKCDWKHIPGLTVDDWARGKKYASLAWDINNSV